MNIIENNSKINELLISKGESKKSWKLLLCELIINDQKKNKEIIDQIGSVLKQEIIINVDLIDLILDVMDFICDYGSKDIIGMLSFSCLNDIKHLNSNKGPQTKKESVQKILYLIQKWKDKHSNDVKKFKEIFDQIESQGIVFPPKEEIIETYTKFIATEEIQDAKAISEYQKKLYQQDLKKTVYSSVVSEQSNLNLSKENKVPNKSENQNQIFDKSNNDENMKNNINISISNNINNQINIYDNKEIKFNNQNEEKIKYNNQNKEENHNYNNKKYEENKNNNHYKKENVFNNNIKMENIINSNIKNENIIFNNN